jgi:hypothetical protein
MSAPSTLASTNPRVVTRSPAALRWSIYVWFALTWAGLLLFALYILVEFGGQLLTEQPLQLFKQTSIDGQAYSGLSQLLLLAHVSLAAAVSALGCLQFIPAIRQRYPHVHRWNGRFFLGVGLIAALSGLLLTWGSNARMSNFGSIGISLNGVLILLIAPFAWWAAAKRKFVLHQRIAMHAFILVNGVWFFRLFLMGWYIANQGPLGNTETLDGPADIVLSFACYLLPMAIAEFVYWAQRQARTAVHILASVLMWVSNLALLLGIAAAAWLMWLPRVVAFAD